MKIISFSQQGPRAICVLSANGLVSNVTLRQPDSSGGTLTYEVRQVHESTGIISAVLVKSSRSSIHFIYDENARLKIRDRRWS